MIMNLYRNIDRNKVQFDFLVHTAEKAAYDDEILALGGRIYHIGTFTGVNALSYYRACNRFFDEHEEFAVVHGHIGSSSAFYLTAAKRHGVFTIAHSHNTRSHAYSLHSMAYSVFSYPTRYIADYLFGCSTKAGIDRFGRAKVNTPKYETIPNAINAADYTFSAVLRKRMRDKLGLSDELVVGHVGRFSPQKNHPFLLEVFAALTEREPNAVLLLVGDGMDMVKIRAKAEAMELSQKVRFLGVRSDVPALMQAMDVFVMPSLFEGLPVTLIEAQAAGLPCVISDVISKESIITDLVSSIKLTDSPGEWADAIIGKKGVFRRNTLSEIIAAGFDITQNAKRLQEFYLDQWKATEKCQH